MSIDVSDVRSNPQDQIAHAARVIGHSDDCRRVFSAIYLGKKKTKKVSEIVKTTSLSRMRVLQEAGKLFNNRIIQRTKVDGELAYVKDSFYTQNKKAVLRLAGNKKALGNFPTKTNPKSKVTVEHIMFLKNMTDAKSMTIDDIDSFSKVRGLEHSHDIAPVGEEMFKKGLQKILGEEGIFQDWGGETDDLFSTRLILKGERKTVAFGLKGKGTQGILTPAKMGKNGDQIQRLFKAPADVFIVQYWAQVDESIIDQLKNFAIAKSVLEGKRIYYGVIDGRDTARILAAYPEYFH